MNKNLKYESIEFEKIIKCEAYLYPISFYFQSLFSGQ